MNATIDRPTPKQQEHYLRALHDGRVRVHAPTSAYHTGAVMLAAAAAPEPPQVTRYGVPGAVRVFTASR